MAIRKREKWYWFLGFQYRFPRRRIWVSLLVTAPITLVGAFLTIRDAVLPRVWGEVRIAEFLPSFYWYWHWYVIIALIYLIILLLVLAPAANRATLERQRERNDEKMRRYKQRVERSFQSVGAPPELSLDVLRKTYELVPLQPNLQHPLEGIVEDAHEGEHGVITRGHSADNENNFRALVATYKNSPDTRPKRRIIEIDGVTAEVSYGGFNGSGVRLHHGAWLSEKDRRVRFEVSGRHGLIVATLEGDRLYAVERETTGVYPNGVTNRTELTSDIYKIRIRLIDAFGAILDDYEMMLTVNRTPELKVELFEARYWKASRLLDLSSKGHDLLTRAYQITINHQEETLAAYKAGGIEADLTSIHAKEKQEAALVATEAKAWELQVGEFLGQHLTEAQKDSFLNAKPSIDDGLNRVRKTPFERIRIGREKDPASNWTLIDSLKARGDRLSKALDRV